MSKIFVFLIMIICSGTSYSQPLNNIIVLTRRNSCIESKLYGLNKLDTTLSWANFESRFINMHREEFNFLIKDIDKKNNTKKQFSKHTRVSKAAIYPSIDSLKNTYIEIYEIGFRNASEATNFYDKINKNNNQRWDMPDVSMPLVFHIKDEYVFIFIDVEEPNITLFTTLSNKIISLIDRPVSTKN